MSYLNWSIVPELLKDKWLQQDFVLDKLYEFSISKSNVDNGIVQKAIASISLELWSNKDFSIKAIHLLIKLKQQDKIPYSYGTIIIYLKI
jgi:hypothetical protein